MTTPKERDGFMLGMSGNRRRSPRIPTELAIQFSTSRAGGETDPPASVGTILDVSNGGMRFQCTARLEPDSQILFSILGRQARPVLSGSAHVLDAVPTATHTVVRARFLEVIYHKAA